MRMQRPDWNDMWLRLRKALANKYVLVCFLFAVVLAFCGEQSMVSYVSRSRQIRILEKELEQSKRETERYKREIRELEEDPANLERFAREHYYMHAKDEDVYLVEE